MGDRGPDVYAHSLIVRRYLRFIAGKPKILGNCCQFAVRISAYHEEAIFSLAALAPVFTLQPILDYNEASRLLIADGRPTLETEDRCKRTSCPLTAPHTD